MSGKEFSDKAVRFAMEVYANEICRWSYLDSRGGVCTAVYRNAGGEVVLWDMPSPNAVLEQRDFAAMRAALKAALEVEGES